MRSTLRIAVLGLCLAALAAGCSKDKSDKPALLVPLKNRIDIKTVWHTKLKDERPKLRLGLDVATDGERVYAASHNGRVYAFSLQHGKQLWRSAVGAPLSAGPAVGDGLVVVGSSKGSIIAMSARTGATRWRWRINSEILSAPAIGDGLVVVRGVDGRLHGMAEKDGVERWVIEQQVPKLSLRGTSRPIIEGGLVICGFDNGRVVGVTARNGSSAWETPVGQSHGSTELQRLIDVDATVIPDQDELFAVAYQGRVAKIERENGQIVWARDLSSYRGLAVDANAVYVSTAEGYLVRLNRRTGTEQWRVKILARRQLSAPVLYHGRVVVGDLEGYLHWFDPATGDMLARVLIGKKQRISQTPVVAGDLLLVFGDNGELSALSAPEFTPR